ncbi:LysR family transcriptional regulator [Trueperella sp.]|uniref:LysR family transcriptional regulator n=1 Tax=Trueperella sp. TaxID=2699835 RepID=UPI0022EA84CD|nr:LysR family transcriptional regulator [Trueperella sp.]
MKYTLNQLRTFTVLAQTQHFGKAADILGVSQPTVSNDVRNLERALGVVLFERSRAGSRLTAAGKALLDQAELVLREAEKLADLASSQVAAETVRFGVSPSMVNRLAPAVLAALDRDARTGGPSVSVELREVETGGLEKLLMRDEADVVVGHFVEAPPGARVATIGHDAIWVVSAQGRYRTDTPVEIASLRDRKLLIWPRENSPRYYDYLVGLLHGSGIDPEVSHAGLRVSGAYSYLLTTGEAYALVPEDYALEIPQSLSAGPISPIAQIPLHVAWHQPASPGVEYLLHMIVKVRKNQSRKKHTRKRRPR